MKTYFVLEIMLNLLLSSDWLLFAISTSNCASISLRPCFLEQRDILNLTVVIVAVVSVHTKVWGDCGAAKLGSKDCLDIEYNKVFSNLGCPRDILIDVAFTSHSLDIKGAMYFLCAYHVPVGGCAHVSEGISQ